MAGVMKMLMNPPECTGARWISGGRLSLRDLVA
jgi:hypothetical protein